MVDLGTGDNNKINWALADKQEFIDIIEVRANPFFCQFAIIGPSPYTVFCSALFFLLIRWSIEEHEKEGV